MAEYKVVRLQFMDDGGAIAPSSYSRDYCPNYKNLTSDISFTGTSFTVKQPCVATSINYTDKQLVCEDDIEWGAACTCDDLEITSSTASFVASGGTVTVGSVPDGDCSISSGSNTPSWIEISNDSGAVKLKAKSNPSGQTRSGTVTFNIDGTDCDGKTVSVSQSAKTGCDCSDFEFIYPTLSVAASSCGVKFTNSGSYVINEQINWGVINGGSKTKKGDFNGFDFSNNEYWVNLSSLWSGTYDIYWEYNNNTSVSGHSSITITCTCDIDDNHAMKMSNANIPYNASNDYSIAVVGKCGDYTGFTVLSDQSWAHDAYVSTDTYAIPCGDATSGNIVKIKVDENTSTDTRSFTLNVSGTTTAGTVCTKSFTFTQDGAPTGPVLNISFKNSLSKAATFKGLTIVFVNTITSKTFEASIDTDDCITVPAGNTTSIKTNVPLSKYIADLPNSYALATATSYIKYFTGNTCNGTSNDAKCVSNLIGLITQDTVSADILLELKTNPSDAHDFVLDSYNALTQIRTRPFITLLDENGNTCFSVAQTKIGGTTHYKENASWKTNGTKVCTVKVWGNIDSIFGLEISEYGGLPLYLACNILDARDGVLTFDLTNHLIGNEIPISEFKDGNKELIFQFNG